MTHKNLINKVKDYRKILNKKNNTIGSILKHHRNEQNLTLEDAANGICSVSYLCKVEKNQLNPSDKILPGLLKKLEIKEISLYNEDSSLWIDNIMTDKLVPLKLYNKSILRKDYKSKLMEYAYEILNEKNYTSARKHYIELTKYFSHFTEEEMCFFLYLTMIVSYEEERYLEVISLSNKINKFNKTSKVIIETNFYHLKATYKLGKDNELKKLNKQVVDKFLNFNELDKLIKARNYSLGLEAKTLSSKRLDEKLNKVKNLSFESQKYIWYIHHYYKKNNLEQALHYIKQISMDKPHYYVMYIITLYQLKKEELLAKALSNPPINNKTSYEIVRNYLLCNDDNKIEFIRNTIVYASFITQEKVILDFLYNEAHRQLKAKYLYKEAVIILEKYNQVLKRTSLVIS